MFLKQNVLNRLMKEAYRTERLSIADTKDEYRKEWIYISGGWWEAEVEKGFIKKETLGNIIALAGELPEENERFAVGKAGNQLEIGKTMTIDDEGFDEEIKITNVELTDLYGMTLRVLQDPATGQMYTVSKIFVDIIDDTIIEREKGEEFWREVLFEQKRGVLWKNDVCKFRMVFCEREQSKEMLERMKGVNLILKERRGE